MFHAQGLCETLSEKWEQKCRGKHRGWWTQFLRKYFTPYCASYPGCGGLERRDSKKKMRSDGTSMKGKVEIFFGDIEGHGEGQKDSGHGSPSLVR